MNETKLIAGLQARQQLARLAEAGNSNALYLDREMEACAVKVAFTPPLKELLREVAFSTREAMVEFARQATIERMQRILNERVAAMDEKEAA